MVKEVTLFEASDGKTFKTKNGAENHEKKVQVDKAVKRLGIDKGEIAKIIERATSYNKTMNALLKHEPNWEKWPQHLIAQLNKDLLKEPKKKTIFVREVLSYGRVNEKEIATEEGVDFADQDFYSEHEDKSYKVVKTENVNEFTLKVYLDYKYTWEQRMVQKLEKGEELSESEVEDLCYQLDKIYEEEGDEGRWERHMTTVVDLEGVHYAIDWSRGLTEGQENMFYEQPYKVKVIEKEVLTTVTYVEKI